MDKPVATKRSVDNGDVVNADDSSCRSDRKRRRTSIAQENQRQPYEDPIPMEIDQVETFESSGHDTVTVASASLENVNDERVTGIARPSPSTTMPIQTRINEETNKVVSRHVPVPPPTPLQVAQRLLDSKNKARKDKAQKYPTAPPPSPFTPQLNKKAGSTTRAGWQHDSKPKLDTINRKYRATHMTSASDVKASKSWFEKVLVPLIICIIPFLLVSTAIPSSKLATSNLHWLQFDGMKRVRSILRDSSIAIPSLSFWKKPKRRLFDHIVPPTHVLEDNHESFLTNTTLRDFLTHSDGIHLAMAPAFFGFYAYFGALAAWNDHLVTLSSLNSSKTFLETNVASVAGGSAGAMAAVLIAAGICPRRAAEYVGTMTLQKFADPPGIGGILKGRLFESLMKDFMQRETDMESISMQDSKTPVAVSAFDIKTFSGKILNKGCMARAARASATFPLLFQPVHWQDDETNKKAFLIDGGVTDGLGLAGLSVLSPEKPKRVVNIVVGGFPGKGPRGPSAMPDGVFATEVVSISILNTPLCGPWAMANGPRAVEASSRAMEASLDLPLYKGNEPGHYELHIDASSFVPNRK